MKQILQSLRTGETELAEVPCPAARPGHLLIRTHCSLISAGTERMLVEFGKSGLVSKARAQPEKVRQVFEKVRTDGLLPTLAAIRSKLDQPFEMGYCNVGSVLEVGQGVEGFRPGDRVASNGRHAEVVCVPRNLCAKVPDEVPDESAVFTVLGAIALQGARLARPTLGEAFAVSGLGLVGLLAVQILRAHGCRVLGLDFNPARLALARQLGAETCDLAVEDPAAAAAQFSRGRGVDGVLIAASTKSEKPIAQAARMCRRRGRVVLIGVVGMQVPRDEFYEKELSFQVSCSYGPGRYDSSYEQQGRDYPLPFVRWTLGRNFEAVLDLLATRQLQTGPLVSHRFPLKRAAEAYGLITGDQPSLGVLLNYGAQAAAGPPRGRTIDLLAAAPAVAVKGDPPPGVAFLGAGSFASGVLAPAFRRAGARLLTVASRGGVAAQHLARRHGFQRATTDLDAVWDDPQVAVVAIATRHDSHADLVCRALAAGKHVFVEKPLALNAEQLERIIAARRACAAAGAAPLVMVGFNRRFARHTVRMAELLRGIRQPKAMLMTVNAGFVPADHWTHDPQVGGGRLVGEGCHFIDLLRFLCGHSIVRAEAAALGSPADAVRQDNISVTLQFADGSLGTIHYLANGHRAVPKERLDVYCGGRVLQLDNWRTLRGYGFVGFRKLRLWRQDKGHVAGVRAFLAAVRRGAASPIPLEEAVAVTRASFDALESLRNCGSTSAAAQPVTADRADRAA